MVDTDEVVLGIAIGAASGIASRAAWEALDMDQRLAQLRAQLQEGMG